MNISEHDPNLADQQALTQRLNGLYRSQKPADAAELAAAVDEASRLRNAEALRRNTARVPLRAPRLAAAILAAAALSVFAGVGVAGALNGLFAPQTGQRLLADDTAQVWTPPSAVPSPPPATESAEPKAVVPAKPVQAKPAPRPHKPKVAAPKPVSHERETEDDEDHHEDHSEDGDEHESDD